MPTHSKTLPSLGRCLKQLLASGDLTDVVLVVSLKWRVVCAAVC